MTQVPTLQTKEQAIASEIDSGPVRDILDEFKGKLASVSPDRLVFWSRGRAFHREREIPSSENCELGMAYRRIQNLINGLPGDGMDSHYRNIPGSYEVINSLLDPLSAGHVLPRKALDCTQIQEDQFWREISEAFAQHARGTITISAASTPAFTNLRMFEFPILMDNLEVTNVRILDGDIVPHNMHAVTSMHNPGDIRLITSDEYDADQFNGMNVRPAAKQKYAPIYSSIIPQLPAREVPKTEWYEWQKQQWYNISKDHLMMFLEEKTDKFPKEHDIGGIYRVPENSEKNILDAEVRFLGEVEFSLKELDRMEAQRARLGEDDADRKRLLDIGIKREMNRLKDAMQVIDTHSFIGDMTSPANELEKKYAGHWRRFRKEGEQYVSDSSIPKEVPYTETLGRMFLQLDESMTNVQKLALWGGFHEYGKERYFHNEEVPQYMRGDKDAMEAYTKDKLEAMLDRAHERVAPQQAQVRESVFHK